MADIRAGRVVSLSAGRLRAACAALMLAAVPAATAHAQSYRVQVKRLDRNLYQAVASKVIVETRACADIDAGSEQPADAILNWEGRFGRNWLMFTASRVKCDIVTIR